MHITTMHHHNPPTWSGVAPLRWHLAFVAGLLVGVAIGVAL